MVRAAMDDPLWVLEDVTLRGRERPRLVGVSARIARGVTLVLGPSGAGKTSLLDLLVAFERPTRGSVRFLGRSRYWVPADFGLWEHLRAREHLEAVHPEGGAAARATARDLLDRFGLADAAERRPAELSSGQQSRLATARALATNAEAIVLDEPFAHLDDDVATSVRDALLEAPAEHGRSLVVATHAPAWLDAAATDRIELLDGAVRSPTASRPRASVLALAAACLALSGACAEGEDGTTMSATHRVFALPATQARAPAPRAVAPGMAGTWLVLDDAGRVLVYAADGRLVRQWSMPEHAAGNPEGVCLLDDGRIAVADTHYHRLVLFDGDGRVVETLGSLGDGPLQFRYPVSVVQDATGHMFVAEYGGNDRVQKLRPDGSFVLAFGRFGSGADELQRPAGLACVAEQVWVADAMNGRVQVFTTEGVHVRSVPGGQDLACPYDVAATDGGDLLVVEWGAGRLTRLAPTGEVRARYGRAGRGADELATPWAVGVRGGLALIADTGNRRLVEVRL